MPREAVKISIYINEADEWDGRPLHLELLRTLHHQGVAGGTVIRAVAGFTAPGTPETAQLVGKGKPPLVIQFIDDATKVEAVMAIVKKMAKDRPIVRETVQIVD